MERDALAARDPLLARRTMGVLGVDIAHEHGFLAAGAVAHAEDARVAVGRGRRVIEHAPAVGALGIADVVAVNGMPRRHVRDGVDHDPLAPGPERVGLGRRRLGGRRPTGIDKRSATESKTALEFPRLFIRKSLAGGAGEVCFLIAGTVEDRIVWMPSRASHSRLVPASVTMIGR